MTAHHGSAFSGHEMPESCGQISQPAADRDWTPAGEASVVEAYHNDVRTREESAAHGDVNGCKRGICPRQYQWHSVAGRRERKRTPHRAGPWLAGKLVLLAPS